MNKILASKWTKALVFIACLEPAAELTWQFYKDALGANPVERLEHKTGDWTIWFLLICLGITPARRLLNMPVLIRYRRMFGLYAFFYGCAHMTMYIWVDQGLDWAALWKDLYKRPFVMAGATGILLMLPLALTSTAWSIRRLGGRNWQRLHRLVYFAALAGVIHYYWLVKSDITLPLLNGAILLVWMSIRAYYWWKPKAQRSNEKTAPSVG